MMTRTPKSTLPISFFSPVLKYGRRGKCETRRECVPSPRLGLPRSDKAPQCHGLRAGLISDGAKTDGLSLSRTAWLPLSAPLLIVVAAPPGNKLLARGGAMRRMPQATRKAERLSRTPHDWFRNLVS
ncbi:hypothetical protein IF1G_04290 [Cordyceps javanica]|uniref:Uncharacterized protein n=1 Tax=Cordyceps javanica TaxID=43265 RepID=A0A545V5R1_9HYPO|nr:hypothetical protein IF1G_04290 [Cordyceps javanica]